MMKRSDFEIMAPVGSYDSLAAAIQGGADSIYFGIEGLNMRSRSSNNFTIDDLHEIVRICNEHGIKSYLTVNTVIYDNDIELLHRIVDAAKEAGLTAIIASDVAAMTYAREVGVEVHLSTQLNISNTEALRFYARFADVVVLARELNLEQVARIHEAIEQYEDVVFYEILAEELALRDMDGEPLTRENYSALMDRIDAYLSEFDQHGTDHISVDLDE